MRYLGQTEYEHRGKDLPQGILLTNLGTPDAPNTASVRRYLREFLADPRVVEIPRLLWLVILYLFILPLRPAHSAKLYRQVWTDNGSPLMDITLRQSRALQAQLDQRFGANRYFVATGMRYGNPSIASALQLLKDKNVAKITVLPLYPQYSGVTTGSTFDAVARELSRYRWIPELSFISGYHRNSLFIQALSDSIQQHIDQHGMPQRLLFSYHGTPLNCLEKGDPYFCFCNETTRLVVEYMGLDADCVLTTFQSRFGKAKWLQPYTVQTLQDLAGAGIENVAVLCPGFAADCLETVEEIDSENRDYFTDAGGKQFHYIPCLNDAATHIEMMAQLIEPHRPDNITASDNQLLSPQA